MVMSEILEYFHPGKLLPSRWRSPGNAERKEVSEDEVALIEINVSEQKEIQSPTVTKPVNSRVSSFARRYVKCLFVPQDKCPDQEDIQYTKCTDNEGQGTECLDQEDGHDTKCCCPPITIILLTVVEVGVFLYYRHADHFNTSLIYNPYKRYEIWRFFTYMLMHEGYVHLITNMILLLFWGVSMEMMHGFWRIWLIYISGVFAGSLGSSISNPQAFLEGASAGVYALYMAAIAYFALVVICLFLVTTDIGAGIYQRYAANDTTNTISYVAHFTGALAGLFVGNIFLRNLEQFKWERIIWWISLVLFIGFMAAMILWNIAYPDYFPPPKY